MVIFIKKGDFYMPFDGLVTKKIVKELSSCLIDGKVNKVVQPNKNQVVFEIYNSR